MVRFLTRRFIRILKAIVSQNTHLNLKAVDLNDPQVTSQIRYHGICAEKEKVVEGIKAVQRLLRIVPSAKSTLVWTLLDAGFSSALEIASMSRTAFLKEMLKRGSMDEASAKEIHKLATAKRSQLLPHVMNDIQNREPHIQSASF